MAETEKMIALLEELCCAPGASGFEDAVLPIARRAAEPYAAVEEDKLRNLYLYRRENTGTKPVILLDAHSDEVGFMVHSIRPNGTLRVQTLGGWAVSTLPGSHVLVRNADGAYIDGVFTAPPMHYAGKQTTEDAISAYSVDVGAVSREEAVCAFRIRVGEPVVPATAFRYDEKNGLFFGKAFDCRIGCTALLEVLKRLRGETLPCDVVGVLSSQEEVGIRGCRVSVRHVKPEAAIAIEGCPADDTFTEPYAIQTALKKGPMFRHMDGYMITHPRFQRFALDTAEETGLPAQQAVRDLGGTDAGMFTYALDGIPSICAGIPVRYSHAMMGISALCDLENTVELIMALLRRLTPEVLAGF